ncbi:hypothetical protein [Candidatus Enterococcus willemsii]|uniref:N-acetyltransferase domain-containing protein n=1 Tax=Candidatus Enterococcus willemsii TaxID=1857215 RepID=A0ABQ6YVV6_9ENTE|nr:hypothetical protein [Enterococcus sp. CU12B]KAF1301467.1 hypothetical protein BAU17_05970 [Enterococcus sp. CU12B]
MTKANLTITPVKPNEQTEHDFLHFPGCLYTKDMCTQDKEEEHQQINQTHSLSSTYSFQGFNGYRDGKIVIRGALIKPHHLDECYLGYFEAIDDEAVMLAFMKELQKQAKKMGAVRLIGPVQGSFWLGYRMKVTGFDSLFTSEPHNLAYYPRLWQVAGFREIEHYASNFYQAISPQYHSKKMTKRYQQFMEKGYQFYSPKRKDWSRVSIEVFHLLRQLYRDFPLYQEITETQFATIFGKLKHVIDFSMVQLAYKENELVGFLITLPDYGNLVYQKLTPLTLAKILYTRWRAKRYILLYLGAKPEHLGLGLAISYPIFKQAKKRHAELIGALIHQGTITKQYVPEMQEKTHEYSLWELVL